MRRGWVPVVCLILAAGGCHKAAQDTDRPASKTVVVGVLGQSDTLDFVGHPQSGVLEVAAATQRGLTFFDEHWSERPAWAVEVPSRQNHLQVGSTRTYHLRPDACWSDNQPLTPDDFTL